MIRLPLVLFFSAVLFSAGVYGVLARKNAVLVLMSIELMLNAVTLNLIAFSQLLGDLAGQVFGLFVIAVAAAEVGIGLAIVRLASLASLPLAALADSYGRRRMLLGCVTGGLAVTALAALSPGYWWFVALFAFGRPMRILSSTVPWNRNVSWLTTAIIARI